MVGSRLLLFRWTPKCLLSVFRYFADEEPVSVVVLWPDFDAVVPVCFDG